MAQFLDAPLAFNVYPPKECTRRLKAQGHNDVDIINREKEAFMWAMQIKALIDKRGEHGTFKTFRDVSQLDFLMREVPWFAQLNEDVRHGLCDHIQVHVVPRNKTLVRETHRHSRWYILLTGSVNKINHPPSKVLQLSSQRSQQTVQTIYINPTSTSLPHETADLDQEQQKTLPSITLYQSVTKHCPHVTSSHTISHSIPTSQPHP
ncbi:hypothetical protein BCR33DRAFT_257705 [Rhizoclosmatium globosum]|uniref:Cyclic nucleotide-binding domain-containing protein n=1 Tax=Rhizoclosmatium globosum TaxID=329046 RepID=A0A1Y2C8R7_9FUNG|nr:hypothetical protein BCR33DRAFT_257705 [Rhizoclosmatium globosum]|eukprot:ORY43307.1 hypothetical protein BCR33DRAFT_257705 [Rhizoclosmatium globosum]